MRRRFSVFGETGFFTGNGDVAWLRLDGEPLTVEDWEHPATDNLVVMLATEDRRQKRPTRLAVVINRSHAPHPFRLPSSIEGEWRDALSDLTVPSFAPARSVTFLVEVFESISRKRI
jgi:glycogen operon protein